MLATTDSPANRRSGFSLAARILFVTGLVLVSSMLACGSGDGGSGSNVLMVDAEFNPATTSNATYGLHETQLAVAQTFTVGTTGRLDQFQLVLRQGPSGSEGTIRIDIRPLLGTGEPENDDLGAIMTPINIDTTTLPDNLDEDFTVFDLSSQPGPSVVAGQQYAIVVTFFNRTMGTPGTPIASLLGRGADEFAAGTGSTNDDASSFTNILTDYFFRTFVLI